MQVNVLSYIIISVISLSLGLIDDNILPDRYY